MVEKLYPGREPITELALRVGDLDQIIVGWDSKSNKHYTLRDFIQARTPETAKKFDLKTSHNDVKRVTDLTPEELKETVVERLRRVSKGLRVGLGTMDFSFPELIREVENGTPIGDTVLQANKSQIDLLECLAETGMLHPRKSSKVSTRPPLFDSM